MGIAKKLVALGMVGAILTGCKFLGFETWHWRQKLVLEVETPRGVVSGGSVVQMDVSRDPKWLPSNPGITQHVRGEASFVEVSPGRYLFAVLTSGGGGDLARRLFTGFPRTENFSEANDKIEQITASAEIPPKNYPGLVTFTDVADPTSVRSVDPNDLAAIFGRGYRLRKIKLEITREPLSEGKVGKVLTWLADVWPNRLDGDRYGRSNSSNPLANSLSANSFSTEVGR